jgi:hypothetical protein
MDRRAIATRWYFESKDTLYVREKDLNEEAMER